MLSRTLYRLNLDTVSLETVGSRKQIVRVPGHSILEVLSVRNDPQGVAMAEVRWTDKILEMFAEDIERRGEALIAQATTNADG